MTGLIPVASLEPTRGAGYGACAQRLRIGCQDGHQPTNPRGSTLGEECTALAPERSPPTSRSSSSGSARDPRSHKGRRSSGSRRPSRRREPQRESVTYQLITNRYLSPELFTTLLRLRVRKRRVLDNLAESPAMALAVNSVIRAIAPELVFRRTENRCACGLRLCVVAINVIHVAE